MQRDPSRLIIRQRVRGSTRAVRAGQNTWVFQTETRVVADVVGAVFPPQLLRSHLVGSTRFSSYAILILVLTFISVSPRSHSLSVTCRISSERKPQLANKTSNTKGTRNDKEMRIQTKTRPKNPLYHQQNVF